MSIDSVNGCDANRSGSCTKAAKFRQRTGIVKKGLMELRALASNVATMSESFSKISILRKGERAAKLSTIAMIFLATLKAVVGFLSGSIALLADAAHSSSDVLTSIAVWLGLAQKKPTERFPYGYYKAESLASLAISIIILVSGIEIVLNSIERLTRPSSISFTFLALTVAALSGASSLVLSRYKEKVGREVNSQALMGESKHSMIDVYVSITVFGGILLSWLGAPWVESLAGFFIGIIIAKVSLGLAKDAVLVLMDACLRPDRIGQMRRIAKSIPGVRGVRNAKIRRSGPFVFGEMHVEVQEGLAVETAHAISDRIEQEIKNSIREIDSLTIHIEPAQIEVVRVAIPIEEDRGLDSPTSPHLGKARYFLFIDVEKGVVKNWFVSRNPGVVLEKKKGVTAAQFLIEQKANVLLAKDLGEGPFHVLKDNFVRTYKLPDNMNIREIMEAFQKEELKALTPVK